MLGHLKYKCSDNSFYNLWLINCYCIFSIQLRLLYSHQFVTPTLILVTWEKVGRMTGQIEAQCW